MSVQQAAQVRDVSTSFRCIGKVALIGLLAHILSSTVHAASLTVTAPGLKVGGSLLVAVFDSEQTWKQRKGAAHTLIVPVDSASPSAVFASLPPGRYALMVFHDLNTDAVLNTSLVGMPKEPYGFSNDARGLFGPPRWSAASFQLNEGDTTVSVRLR
jgi:uncharacterized protein (DUF2141 family)